jgi:hypothetical protein
MNEAGISFIRRRTRLSAGWRRSCSESNSRPFPSGVKITISPSRTNRGSPSVLTASPISGKYRLNGSSFRLDR